MVKIENERTKENFTFYISQQVEAVKGFPELDAVMGHIVP